VTSISTQDDELVVITQINHSLLNTYNPVKLSVWRANGDIQYVMSREKVTRYVAKYGSLAPRH